MKARTEHDPVLMVRASQRATPDGWRTARWACQLTLSTLGGALAGFAALAAWAVARGGPGSGLEDRGWFEGLIDALIWYPVLLGVFGALPLIAFGASTWFAPWRVPRGWVGALVGAALAAAWQVAALRLVEDETLGASLLIAPVVGAVTVFVRGRLLEVLEQRRPQAG